LRAANPEQIASATARISTPRIARRRNEARFRDSYGATGEWCSAPFLEAAALEAHQQSGAYCGQTPDAYQEQ
jgi:hypothetical protein